MNPVELQAQLAAQSSAELLKLGVAGVFIIFLITCLWLLWGFVGKLKLEVIAAHKEHREAAEKYSASLLDVVKETTKTVQQQSMMSSAVAAAVETANRSNEGRTAAIERLAGQVENMKADLQGIRISCGGKG